MPTIKRYFPALSEVVTLDDFPPALSFVKNGVTPMFSKLYYKDLQFSKSPLGDSAFYSLKLISRNRLEFEIPGTGAYIVINPDDDQDDISATPVSVSYQWKILGILQAFNKNGFKIGIQHLFEIAKEGLKLSDDLVVSHALNQVVEPQGTNTRVQQLVADVNTAYETSITVPTNGNPVPQLVTSIETATGQSAWMVILGTYISNSADVNDAWKRLKEFFRTLITDDVEKYVFDLITPKIKASLTLSATLELPRTWLLPVNPTTLEALPEDLDGSGNPLGTPRAQFTFASTTLSLDSERGVAMDMEFALSTTTPVMFGKTRLVANIQNLKLDLSDKKNITEANLDGRSAGFKGVYIERCEVYLPLGWLNYHNDNDSTAVIVGRDLLIGTGGFTGNLELEKKNESLPTSIIKLEIGDMVLTLDKFSMGFKQNAIIYSKILGSLTLPGFKQGTQDAKILVEASIADNGNFNIGAKLNEPVTAISIPEILDLGISALGFSKINGKFCADIEGEVDFTVTVPNISTNFPKKLPMKIRVWENGKIEFDKGTIILPKAIKLEIGPVKLAVTALHFGSAEMKDNNGDMRQYSFIGFDGALNINPGGVGVRGEGVKLFYTTDNGTPHRFIRVAGIGIDILIPGNASGPDQAEVFFKGYLSVKNKEAGESGPATTEYAGSIEFAVNKAKVKGAAAMRYNPSIPSFLIDIGIEFPASIPVGTTGLSIYAVRGLMAQNYRLNKADEETWWKFYKTPQEGINSEKFYSDKGFSVGLGVSFATQADSGKSFSSKLLMLLGLPDVFLLTGQAAILDERVALTDPDPPFSAMLAISKTAIEAGFGVNYKLPKNTGSVIDAQGDIQMAYFFKNSSAWYINIGKDLPEEERVRAKILSLFNAYAYLMISAQGIKFGAGSKYEFKQDFKVAKVDAAMYQNMFARLSFRPTQLGGGIEQGGYAYISIAKFKLGASLNVHLGVDAFKPFKVAGGAEVAVDLPRPFKNKKVQIDFVWTFDNDRPTTPLKAIEPVDNQAPVKAINMLTGEDYTVNYSQSALPSNISWIDKTIPLDSYIDVDFIHSVKTELETGSALIFGEATSPDYRTSVPPEQGLTEPVRHEFKLKKVLIKAWDGSAWVDYNVYEGVSAISNIPEIQTALLNNPNYLKEFPQGFWQAKIPNKNTHLRIMGQNMFSYLNSVTDGAIKLEYMGYKGEAILCEEDKIQPTCINWEDVSISTEYQANELINYKGITFNIINSNGTVTSQAGYGLNNGLNFTTAEGIEIYFNEPQGFVKPSVTLTSPNKLIVEYYKEVIEGYDVNDNPLYIYSKVQTDSVAANDLSSYNGYNNADVPVKKIKISVDRSGQAVLNPGQTDDLLLGHVSYYNYASWYYNNFDGHIIDEAIIIGRALTALEIDDLRINNNSGPNVIAHWELNGNANDSSGNGYNGTLVPNPTKNPMQVYGRNNIANNAYFFYDNSGSYTNNHISVPHNDELSLGKDNFTIAFWVKFPQVFGSQNLNSGNKFLISKSGASGGYTFEVILHPQYSASPYKEYVNFTLNNNDSLTPANNFTVINNTNYTGTVLNDNQWHFVAVTVNFDTNESIIYIDDAIQNKNSLYRPALNLGNNNNAYLHQLCLLSEKQSKYNQSIPPQSKLTSENTQMADGLIKLFQPVWRPDTNYAIEITTSDNVDGSGDTNHQFTVGFKTAGPIGYFHDLDSRYTSLSSDMRDMYQLANLKHYINYNRSFPNAEGKLLNNKPLFYNEPSLHLYFNYPYVNAMYSQWQAYNGVPVSDYVLELYVADPLNEQQNANALQPSWVPGKLVVETEDVRMLNNLINNGQNCSGLSGPLERLAYNAKYVLPDLRPNTLYTAVYNAVNGSNKANVHQHVFVTSRYATFQEQIESYILGNDAKAIYPNSFAVTSGEITKAINIITDNASQDSDLVKKFADKYDRLIDGVLNKINPLQAAVTTEFNIIKNSNDQKVIGLLIRNPEPIFNPQLASADLLNSITVVNNLQAGGTESNYRFISSKDCSAIFITKDTLEIPQGVLNITMKYLEYDGTAYLLKTPQAENEITVDITIS